MKEIKIGLIGLGFMGTTHFGIYQALPGVRVAALADIDPMKLSGDISAVSGNIGEGSGSKLDLTGIACYSDPFRLIAEADVDAVDICVPTPWHRELALAACAAGKHLFVEKPLCLNEEELREISAAVKAAGVFFNVGLCVRMWPEYLHARELYASGAVGRVRSANFRRLSPSVDGNAWENWFMTEARSKGALLDLHLHDADQVRCFFGRPKRVTSFGVRGVVSDHAIDHVVTSYDFGDGAMIVAEGGWAAAKGVPFEMSFQIICEKATIKLDAGGYHIYWNDGRVESPQVVDEKLPTGWHQELNYFVKCLAENTPPVAYQTLESIADSHRIVFAEEKSVDSGKTVEVDYV